MNLKDWAKSEVDRAIEKGEGDEYTELCYKSALKAFESLLDDEHSGYSFSVTKSILERLMNNQPLDAITEEDFNNAEKMCAGNIMSYQCHRYSSLFKNVQEERISYNDVQRVVFIDDKGLSWGSGLADDVINEKYPITLPYYPKSQKYRVYGWDCMYSKDKGIYREKGCYNLKYFDYVITPDGDKEKLNKMYLEDEDRKMKEVKGFKKHLILKAYAKYKEIESCEKLAD